VCERHAGCLSLKKAAAQISEELPASLAVDGDVTTHSCTEDADPLPWWSVDLEQGYSIDHVTVTLPNVGGDRRNYRNYLQSCFIW